MNMEHLQSSVVSCLLLVGILTKVFSHPAIAADYQLHNNLMTKCMSNCDTKNPYMYPSPVAYDVYQTNDPNANYPYPSFASVMPAFDYYPKFDRIEEPNLDKDDEQRALIDSEFLDKIYAVMLDDMRESVEPRTPSSGSRDRSVSDEDYARSAVAFDKQSTNPEIFREIEAALINFLTGKRDKRTQSLFGTTNNKTSFMGTSEAQKLSTDKLLAYLFQQPISFAQSTEQGRPFADPIMYQGSNYYTPSSAFTQSASPPLQVGSFATKYDHPTNTMFNATNSGYAGEPQKQYSFNSAYFPYPAPWMPMPLMQTTQQANPAGPMFYPPVEYAMPPSSYAMPPSPYAVPPSPYAVPHSPFSPGLHPPAYSSQNEASFYLQPVYTAPLPSQSPSFQVWPVGSQYRPSPDFNYTTILGGNSTRGNLQNLPPNTNKKPIETSLLKFFYDQVTEKKTNPRHSRERQGPTKVATGKRTLKNIPDMNQQRV